MKIAFLHMYMGIINRGSEIVTSDLANKLAINNEVTVFQSGKAKGTESYKIKRIPIMLDWKKKSPSGTIWEKLLINYWEMKVMFFTLKAVPFILKEKFNIVIPINGTWMSFIVRFITRLYGGKMIITGHAGMGWDDQINLKSKPDVFVALSPAARRWAENISPKAKIVYISNGIDISKFSPTGPKFKISLKKPIVLCVSALAPAKRVDLIIKAVSKMESASLLVVGDGELKGEVSKFGADLLRGRFKLISVPFEKMPYIYRSCDVFTNSSIPQISFERVIVEAMASGLPIVANKDEIREKIVGKAGYLVDPLNSDKYASLLMKAINKKWGNTPREQASKFTLDRTVESYENLFNKLIRNA